MNQHQSNDAWRTPVIHHAHTTPDPDAPNDPPAPPNPPPVPDDVPDPVNAPVEEPRMPEPPIRAH